MKLTRSAGYALIAVGHIAQEYPSDPVLAKSIAKQYRIPLDYLLKILQQLVRANVLNSVRGPHGGFTLARQPAKVSFLDIIEAVDGPFVVTPAIADARVNSTFSRRLVATYEKSAQEAARILKKTTIADLGGSTSAKKTARKKTAKRKTRR
ncbi:MAG: Rrf2 family transcriptional regulator [Sedimentisphaerales bacterium]|nr:Rrf2 family transcriptional regulator [Sedimentisphaerales bacterium]